MGTNRAAFCLPTEQQQRGSPCQTVIHWTDYDRQPAWSNIDTGHSGPKVQEKPPVPPVKDPVKGDTATRTIRPQSRTSADRRSRGPQPKAVMGIRKPPCRDNRTAVLFILELDPVAPLSLDERMHASTKAAPFTNHQRLDR